MNPLIGKTITAIYLAEDQKAIKFDIDGGEPIIARADADCCSETWIENVENWEALIGSPVLTAEDIDMPVARAGGDDYYDVIQFYGFKITTTKGACVLDYRNSSNGYYGGDLVWPGADDYFYGGVYGQNVSKNVWKTLE